jgi:transcriptional regulator with XRE-family HTH domain
MRRRYKSLTEYFDHSGDTQSALAARLGVAQTQISLWTNGVNFPRPRMALRLSTATGVPVENILKAMRPKGGKAA